MESVYSAVRTGTLNKTYYVSSLNELIQLYLKCFLNFQSLLLHVSANCFYIIMRCSTHVPKLNCIPVNTQNDVLGRENKTLTLFVKYSMSQVYLISKIFYVCGNDNDDDNDNNNNNM